MGEPLNVGVVGLGKISTAYLSTFERLANVNVTALADLDPARATAALRHAPGARALHTEELMVADDVDLVLNLTIPAAHAEVARMALAAGKHVYNEKPLALDVAQARAVVTSAADGLRVGCAPDTVLGTGTQTARHTIAQGLIGTPVAANATFASRGHEYWHPDPEFYYRPGGGPLFDMGPYYLTALIHLLGPVRSVVGAASRSRAKRTIATGPRAGSDFDVEVDTHVTGVLTHESGALSTLITSFDVVASDQPLMEVHGSHGSISVPDPNRFDGEVRIRHAGAPDWQVIEPSAGYIDSARGIGVADLAQSLAAGRPHRTSADVALHVLDIMQSLLAAAAKESAVDVTTSCIVPELVPHSSA